MWRLTCLWNRWKYCAGVSYLWHRTYLQSRWKYWAKMGYLWHRTCLRRRWKYWAGVVGLATSMLTLSPSTFTSLLSHIYNKNTRNHNTGYTNCHIMCVQLDWLNSGCYSKPGHKKFRYFLSLLRGSKHCLSKKTLNLKKARLDCITLFSTRSHWDGNHLKGPNFWIRTKGRKRLRHEREREGEDLTETSNDLTFRFKNLVQDTTQYLPLRTFIVNLWDQIRLEKSMLQTRILNIEFFYLNLAVSKFSSNFFWYKHKCVINKFHFC